MNYTLRELMVAAAAREIHDGDKVFVGMRLPLLAWISHKERQDASSGVYPSIIVES